MTQEVTTSSVADWGFPRLPPELRKQVWQDCVPTGRTFRAKLIWPQGDSANCRYNAPIKGPKLAIQRSAIPPVLRVCQESRGEALSVYQPLFRRDSILQVYVHIDSDSLYLDENLDRDLSPLHIEFSLLNFPYCRLMETALSLAFTPKFETALRRGLPAVVLI